MTEQLRDLTGIRIACCSRNHKRAALLFDYVTTAIAPGEDQPQEFPDDIFCYDGQLAEIVLRNDRGAEAFERDVAFLTKIKGKVDLPFTDIWQVSRDFRLIDFARLYRQQGAEAAVFDLAFPGTLTYLNQQNVTSPGILATLSQIPVAVEAELSWQQVRDFREDREAQRKYRDLHLWLQSGLSAKTEWQAKDIIEQKISDYRWAIKKHGIKTAAETITSLLGLGSVVPAAGGVAAEAMKLGPVYGMLAGGSLVIAGTAAWIAKRQIEKEDIKRGTNREIAYLYEIQHLVE